MIQRLLMISVFAIFLFAVAYWPISRLFSYFNLSGAWMVTTISVLIFPVGLTIASVVRSSWVNYLGYLTNGLFGTLLAFLTVAYLVELATFLTRTQSPANGWIILGLTLVIVIVSFVSANVWQVKEIVIESDKIKEEINFVQLTDLHAYGAHAPKNIRGVFDRALELNPDFIVVTGDMVDMPGKPPLDTFKVLDDIDIPIIYEFGNHEAYVGLDYVRDMVAQSKVKLVEDNVWNYKDVQIVSVSDSEDKTYVEKTLPTIKRNQSKFQVLLYHKPLEYKAAAANGMELQLSGHTHAGQYLPVHAIVMIMYKYPWGTHDIDGMTLHVNPGSGTFTWPLRIFSTNQITHIKLVPKNI